MLAGKEETGELYYVFEFEWLDFLYLFHRLRDENGHIIEHTQVILFPSWSYFLLQLISKLDWNIRLFIYNLLTRDLQNVYIVSKWFFVFHSFFLFLFLLHSLSVVLVGPTDGCLHHVEISVSALTLSSNFNCWMQLTVFGFWFLIFIFFSCYQLTR